jgi:hypothetical protein
MPAMLNIPTVRLPAAPEKSNFRADISAARHGAIVS